jgi:hypothetical protein
LTASKFIKRQQVEAALSAAVVWLRQQQRLRQPLGKALASAVRQEVASEAAGWRQ